MQNKKKLFTVIYFAAQLFNGRIPEVEMSSKVITKSCCGRKLENSREFSRNLEIKILLL